jgi:hypothetical protein
MPAQVTDPVPGVERAGVTEPVGDELPGVLDALIVPFHRPDLQHQTGLFDQLGERLCLRHCRGQGLLHQHVLAGSQRLSCNRVVEPVRCGDDDRLDRPVGEHLGLVGVGRRQAVAAGHRTGHVLARVADRNELHAFGLLQRRQVRHLGDPAATN